MTSVLTDRVTGAIRAGAEELFARQRPDGAFEVETPGSVLGTAGAVAALHAVGAADDAELVAAGVEWLRRAQRPDGGWGGVEGADTAVVPTAIAVGALALVGGSDEAVAAGTAALAADGGMAAVHDRAVAHMCHQFLALGGLPGGERARRLPLEVVLADRVRRQKIGFRTAPFVGLALLGDAITPATGLRRRTIAAARPRALALLGQIDAHEGHTGAFSQDPWPAALVLLGLARSGEAPHLVASISGFLRRSVRADGGWDAVYDLDLTRSAFAATGLLGAGYRDDPRLAATRELFHRTQQTEAFTVLDCPPGGWSFSDAHGWPVLLESAEILAALAGLPDGLTDPVLASGLDWMTGRQDTRGSWSLWVRDTKLANDGPCPAITSQAITALVRGGRADAPAIDAAVRWLTARQAPDGTFENCWYRDRTSGTAMVLDGLSDAGRAHEPPAVRARETLLGFQHPDGSWGDGSGDPATASVEETAWAVHALLASGGPAAAAQEPVRRGVGWLLDAQLPDGSWPATRVCAYIRHYVHYPNPAITRGLALRALGTYRTCEETSP